MRTWRLLFPTVVLVVFCASGCGLLPGDGEPSRYTLEEDGQACLSNDGDGGDAQLAAGSTSIRVAFRSCLGCGDSVQTSECSYELDGNRIVVDSRLVIRSEPTDGPCPAVCQDAPQTTNCEGPELQEQDYTLVHGDASTEFTVPGSERVCAGPPP